MRGLIVNDVQTESCLYQDAVITITYKLVTICKLLNLVSRFKRMYLSKTQEVDEQIEVDLQYYYVMDELEFVVVVASD